MKPLIRNAVMFVNAFLGLVQSARAEEDQGDPIVVTGIRQAYQGNFEAREIPQAIGVIQAETLQDNIIFRLTDALDLNASVARQNNFGGLWDAYAVRGFAGDENLPSGYLVNGFNGGRGFGGARDVAGVERVEVLKGPGAALFGRGEPGGTINIVTKRAQFNRTTGSFSAVYGAFDRVRVDADANLSLGDAVAVRLIGFSEDSGSFRRTVDSHRYGLLPTISFKIGARTELTYDLEYTRSEADFDRGVPAINGVLGLVSRKQFLGEPGDGPLRADVTGHQFQLQHEFSSAWSLLVGANYRETDLEGFSTEADLASGRQTLGRPATPSLLARQRRFRDYESEHLVLRGEIAGDFRLAGLRHRILLGADFDRFDNDQDFRGARAALVSTNPSEQASNAIDVFNPVFGRFPLPLPLPQTDRLDRQKATGFYFQDQIGLSDAVQIRLGIRFDNYSLETFNRRNNTRLKRSFDRISPQFGLVVRASPELSFYAAYGEGFRSNIGARANGEIFDPETSTSYEAGAKFELFSGRLGGTLAFFSLRKRNVLAADIANPGFSIPIGKAASKGIEFDVNGKLPGGLDLLFSYAFVDAEARADVADPNFTLQIRKGDPLINIPRHSLNAQISRDFQFGERGFRIGAGVQHVGRRLGETATRFFLPDYTIVRLFANAEISKGIELFADVKNLFDETYFTNSFARLWVRPGDPRTATGGVRVKF